MQIDNKLKEFREFLGLKQKTFAEELSVPLQTYIRYEHNKREAPSGLLKKIANKYGVDLNTLYTGTITGSNNIQAIGKNNIVESSRGELDELMELIRDYAPPKMIKDLKEKLLKIKGELND